jgi:predicted enzyme related to lactoylglutathione lyase
LQVLVVSSIKGKKMENTVVWFDIPVKNLERAMVFYGKVLGVSLQPFDKAPVPTAFFPFAPGVVSGGLVQSKDRRPSDQGATVYLNGGKDLAGPLSRVEAAGGKVLQPKTAIGEHGFVAYFTDTEGNRVGVHSPS